MKLVVIALALFFVTNAHAQKTLPCTPYAKAAGFNDLQNFQKEAKLDKFQEGFTKYCIANSANTECKTEKVVRSKAMARVEEIKRQDRCARPFQFDGGKESLIFIIKTYVPRK